MLTVGGCSVFDRGVFARVARSDLKSVKTNGVDWNKGKVAKRFKVLTNVSLLL